MHLFLKPSRWKSRLFSVYIVLHSCNINIFCGWKEKNPYLISGIPLGQYLCPLTILEDCCLSTLYILFNGIMMALIWIWITNGWWSSGHISEPWGHKQQIHSVPRQSKAACKLAAVVTLASQITKGLSV